MIGEGWVWPTPLLLPILTAHSSHRRYHHAAMSVAACAPAAATTRSPSRTCLRGGSRPAWPPLHASSAACARPTKLPPPGYAVARTGSQDPHHHARSFASARCCRMTTERGERACQALTVAAPLSQWNPPRVACTHAAAGKHAVAGAIGTHPTSPSRDAPLSLARATRRAPHACVRACVQELRMCVPQSPYFTMLQIFSGLAQKATHVESKMDMHPMVGQRGAAQRTS